MKTCPEELQGLYDPIEHAVLAEWLRVRPPACAAEVDPWEVDSGSGSATSAVAPRPDCWGNLDFCRAADNAVARLVLNAVQGRLPVWAGVDAAGNVFSDRSLEPKRQERLAVLARFLFEINWATSGPGYAWPEAYHVGYLPGYDVFVVTASGDCAEVHGYADRTLGAFSGDEGLLDTALAIIQAEWSRQRAEWDQRRWERVNDPGCFLLEALEAAADEVWSDVAGEGEADPEESYEDFDLQEPIPEEG